MQWQRVVEIHGGPRGQHGTGYLLAPGLALTARHVVNGLAATECACWRPTRTGFRARRPMAGGACRLDGRGRRSRAAGRRRGRAVPRAGGRRRRSAAWTAARRCAWTRWVSRARCWTRPTATSCSRGAGQRLERRAQRGRCCSRCRPRGRPRTTAGRACRARRCLPGTAWSASSRPCPRSWLPPRCAPRRPISCSQTSPPGSSCAPRRSSLRPDRWMPRTSTPCRWPATWGGMREQYARAVVAEFCSIDFHGLAVTGALDRRMPALAAFTARMLRSWPDWAAAREPAIWASSAR